MFQNSLLVPSSRVKQPWPLKMGLIGCPKTSVTNYQSMLRNISEGWRQRCPCLSHGPRLRLVLSVTSLCQCLFRFFHMTQCLHNMFVISVYPSVCTALCISILRQTQPSYCYILHHHSLCISSTHIQLQSLPRYCTLNPIYVLHWSTPFQSYLSFLSLNLFQGPCCTTTCELKFGDKCRDDNGCRDASFCDGRGPQCPPSINKPNKTICNEEFVCFMGVSGGILYKFCGGKWRSFITFHHKIVVREMEWMENTSNPNKSVQYISMCVCVLGQGWCVCGVRSFKGYNFLLMHLVEFLSSFHA
jgi:hypothetical protein